MNLKIWSGLLLFGLLALGCFGVLAAEKGLLATLAFFGVVAGAVAVVLTAAALLLTGLEERLSKKTRDKNE